MKLTNWKLEAAFVVAIFGCIALSQCAHATAPTGYDVMRVELPDAGYAQLLAGCTLYNEPDDLTVMWCEDDSFRDTLTPHPMPSRTATWGIIAPTFAWYPTWGACRLLEKTEYDTYTAYSISCSGDNIFADNMGD